MSNFKSQSKRQRELAKLNKRQAKDQKRAVRKAERAGSGATVPPIVAVAQPAETSRRLLGQANAPSKPLTLAEAVERWKTTKVAEVKRR